MDGYYAGWDGGGTGTVVECASSDGHILFRGKAGPLNFNGSTPEKIKATVLDAISQMNALPGGLEACLGLCIACAGSSSQANRDLMERFLKEAGCHIPHLLVGDHESALSGALEGKPGMVLISGTGSICLGKNSQGQVHRCGGRGHLIDDGGSGYAIGRDILSAVVQAEDGRIPFTLLTEMVYSHLDISGVEELIGFLYAPDTSKKEIASLAPLAAKACELGDSAAVRVESRAAEELFLLAETTAKQLLLTRAPLAFSGSILNKDSVIRELVAKKAKQSSFRLLPCLPSGDGAHGAVLIARSHFPA